MSQLSNGLARAVRAQQPEHPGTGLHRHPGHRLGAAEPPGHIADLNVHDVPFGIRVANHAMAPQAAAPAR